MTRHEFLNTLRTTLESELSSNVIQGHINYYNDYINAEVASGRSESDVISELGDPWAIAKNILASEVTESNNYEEYSYNSSEQETSKPNVHIFGIDSWWKKLLLIFGIIGVVMIVFSIITGIISLIAPFIIPFLIISFVFKFFKKK